MLYLLILALLFSLVISVPLEPGQPGGPWTEEEIDIVRAKVKNHSPFLSLNFAVYNRDRFQIKSSL